MSSGYGMTEGTCVTCTQPVNGWKCGSVGKLVPNTFAKVVLNFEGKLLVQKLEKIIAKRVKIESLMVPSLLPDNRHPHRRGT